MQAALYARVSTDKQKDEQTIATQLNEIMKVIQSDGNTLLPENIYQDDGWSGAFINRPALDLMRQAAKLRKFEILYVYDKGRLSRKFVHQEIILDELRKLEIEFKSLHDVNGKSPEEMAMSGVMGIFHEYERTKTAERFRLAKLNKVSNGHLLGYNPPYGYDYIPVQGKGLNKTNGRFEINDIEAEVVRKIFNWVGNENMPLREVIRTLHDEKILPKKGKRSTWTKGPIARLLRNESYIGKHHYNKSESCLPKNPIKKREHFQHTDKTSRRTRDKSEWLIVKVPAIIEEGLFNKVQTQLSLNVKYSKRNTKHEYLFSGLMYCTCGHKRTSEGARGHYYYRCTERLHTFPEPATCKERSINVSIMDSVAWNKLVILLTEPNLIEQQLERYLDHFKNRPRVNEDLKRLTKALAGLSSEEKRYVGAYGRGSLTDNVFDEHMSDVNRRKATLQNQIDNMNHDEQSELPEYDINDIQKRFTHLLGELTFEDKLYTVRKIIDKIVATKEEITICGKIPLIPPHDSEKAGLHAKHWYRRPS